MKLSEAIRAGAKQRPKATRAMFGLNSDGVRTSCALGGAFEVATGIFPSKMSADFSNEVMERMREMFPILKRRAPHPVEYWWVSLSEAIVNLNDIHGWSREAISEWVQVVENEIEEAEAREAERIRVQSTE